MPRLALKIYQMKSIGMFAFKADKEVSRSNAAYKKNYAENELPPHKTNAPRAVHGVDVGVVEHGYNRTKRHARDGEKGGRAALFQQL